MNPLLFSPQGNNEEMPRYERESTPKQTNRRPSTLQEQPDGCRKEKEDQNARRSAEIEKLPY
jgi:hypothetical protein